VRSRRPWRGRGDEGGAGELECGIGASYGGGKKERNAVATVSRSSLDLCIVLNDGGSEKCHRGFGHVVVTCITL
jgi:hypothetical protein